MKFDYIALAILILAALTGFDRSPRLEPWLKPRVEPTRSSSQVHPLFGEIITDPAVASNSSGPSYHAETLDYIARVEAAGGGLTDSQKSAVDAFVLASYSQGWRSKVWRCNIYLGTNLVSATAPLFHGTNSAHYPIGMETNEVSTSFVEGDFSQAGGITPALGKSFSIGQVTNMYQAGGVGSNCFYATFFHGHVAADGAIAGARYTSLIQESYSGNMEANYGNATGTDNRTTVAAFKGAALTNFIVMEVDGTVFVTRDGTNILVEAAKRGSAIIEGVHRTINGESYFYPTNTLGYAFGVGLSTNEAQHMFGAIRTLNAAVGR